MSPKRVCNAASVTEASIQLPRSLVFKTIATIHTHFYHHHPTSSVCLSVFTPTSVAKLVYPQPVCITPVYPCSSVHSNHNTPYNVQITIINNKYQQLTKNITNKHTPTRPQQKKNKPNFYPTHFNPCPLLCFLCCAPDPVPPRPSRPSPNASDSPSPKKTQQQRCSISPPDREFN